MGSGSGVAVNCGVGHSYGSDPVLLWLWCRQAAVGSLAWQPPCAVGSDLKTKKKKKEEEVNRISDSGASHTFIKEVVEGEDGSITFPFFLFIYRSDSSPYPLHSRSSLTS